MKSEIEKLESVHPDLITTFLTTGEGKGIPEDVQTFLKQLQWAAEIYELSLIHISEPTRH